jgi:hypothetical protein
MLLGCKPKIVLLFRVEFGMFVLLVPFFHIYRSIPVINCVRDKSRLQSHFRNASNKNNLITEKKLFCK